MFTKVFSNMIVCNKLFILLPWYLDVDEAKIKQGIESPPPPFHRNNW